MVSALPVDEVVPELLSALSRRGAAVLRAPPGAGKTTRVPAAALDAGAAAGGEVIVVQPRRLAARMAAARVAAERGQRVGREVGYEVRFERRTGPKTRLRFVTDGVLRRRLAGDPELKGAGVVILDEFHERRLSTDVALARLRELQEGRRPDLRLAVMSATLHAGDVAERLGDCPALVCEGAAHPVTIEHAPGSDELPLERKVSGALRRLVQGGLEGHVLVFLPGAAEIRRAAEACEEVARRAGLEIARLHGDLPAEEQDRAVAPSRRRRVILATNVAETSITVDGVEAVIDSGLARVHRHDPWSGVPRLEIEPISRASADQRAGRAGRTRPGRCVRLYTARDFDARPARDTPEVARADLAEVVLELRAAGVTDVESFPWFESPPAPGLRAASELLERLGAVDATGVITDTGRRMARLPLHPRLARVLIGAQARGVADAGADVAALAGERPIALERRGGGGAPAASGPADLLEDLERLRAARDAGFRAERLRAEGIDATAARAADRAARQIARAIAAEPGPGAKPPASAREVDRALQIAILTGFPDRLARRRAPGGRELVLAGGGSASLSPQSVVVDADLVVATDVEARGPRGAVVRSASAVEPDWLLELYLERVAEEDELAFSPSSERVERVSRLSLFGLVFEETRDPAAARRRPEEAADVLARAARAAGPGRFVDLEELARWRRRVALAGERAGEPDLTPPTDDEVAEIIAELCAGLTSFAELEAAPVLDAARARLPAEKRRRVDELAPEHVSLPGRRRVRVHYEEDRPPWIASRLQDFFGMTEGPAVAGGRVPLVLHLLAPNGRAVQVTSDLAGFWTRHYPAVRRELSRRYPRHAWPENPREARPDRGGSRRGGGRRPGRAR